MKIFEPRTRVLIATVALAAPIFALDLLTPHGIAVWLLYLIPLLLVSRVAGPRGTYLWASVFSALSGLGFWLSPPGISRTVALINCSLAVLVLWVATLFLVQRIRAEARAEAERLRLLSEVEAARLRAEEMAREAERRAEELDAVFAAMTDGVAVYDVQGKPVRSNPAAVREFGLDFETIPPRDLVDRLAIRHPDGRPVAFEEMPSQRAWRGETLRGERFHLTHPDGRQLTILASAAPVILGGEVRGAVAVWRDITDREELLAQIAQERDKLRALIGSIVDEVWMSDAAGHLSLLNPTSGLEPGSRREEEVSRQILEGAPDLEVVTPDGESRRHEDAPLRRALRGEIVTDVEEIVRHPHTGELVHRLVSAAPLRSPEGATAGAVAVVHDITQRRQAEQALHAAGAMLETRLEERSGGGEIGVLSPEDGIPRRAEEELKGLSKALERRAAELVALDRVGLALTASLDRETVLKLLCGEVRGLLKTEAAAVLIHEPEGARLVVVAAEGAPFEGMLGRRLSASTGIVGRVWRERQSVLANDVQVDPPPDEGIEAPTDVRARSLLATPLIFRGAAQGVLVTVNATAGCFSEEDKRILTAIANAAAVAIENARLYETEQVRRSQLEAVRSVATEITRELDLPTLLRLIAQCAGELLGASMGTVWLWDEEAQMLIPRASLGQEGKAEVQRLRLGEGVAGAVAQRREGMGTAAVLAEPLMYHDRLVGVIALDNEGTGRPFRPEDQELLGLFAAHAAIAIGNARLYQELRVHRDRLRALTAQTLRSREEEAKRIARELHDEIGQSLTCVLLGMQGLEGIENVEEVRRKVHEVRALVAKPLGDIQRLVRALRPVILDDLGLVAALERHVKGYAAATGLHAEFYSWGLERVRLSAALETSLYRMMQEALTNVAKHAKARNVSVLLRRRGEMIALVVEDDGKGFDVSAARESQAGDTGVGLLGMEERAFLLGGSVTIESAPGRGTTIVVTLPLETAEGSHGENEGRDR